MVASRPNWRQRLCGSQGGAARAPSLPPLDPTPRIPERSTTTESAGSAWPPALWPTSRSVSFDPDETASLTASATSSSDCGRQVPAGEPRSTWPILAYGRERFFRSLDDHPTTLSRGLHQHNTSGSRIAPGQRLARLRQRQRQHPERGRSAPGCRSPISPIVGYPCKRTQRRDRAVGRRCRRPPGEAPQARVPPKRLRARRKSLGPTHTPSRGGRLSLVRLDGYPHSPILSLAPRLGPANPAAKGSRRFQFPDELISEASLRPDQVRRPRT